MGYPFAPLLRLLLLTGQRRSEVADMQWSELDLDEGIWIIPAARSKNDKEHLVPLSSQAVAVINTLPRFDGPYVFSTTEGRRPVSACRLTSSGLSCLFIPGVTMGAWALLLGARRRGSRALALFRSHLALEPLGVSPPLFV